VQHNLHVGTTRQRLADLAREHRWHNAIHLRGRPSALTENRTMDPCDFNHHTSRKEQPTRMLARCTLACLAAHSDIRRMGHPGTGQTFLATCLADAACTANVKGRCTTAMDMINHRMAAEADHALLQKLHLYATPDLRVCDEWGSLALGQQGSPLVFQGIRQRPQRHSTVRTTNVPLAEWGKGLDATPVATAVADRLVHHSAVLILGGSSYRRKRTEHPPRRTTEVKEGVQASPLASHALFLSLCPRHQGTRASP